jgi:hypothetical protein
MQLQYLFLHSRLRKKVELFLLLSILLAFLSFTLIQASYIYYSVPVIVSFFVQLYRKDDTLLKRTGIALHTICTCEYFVLSFPFIFSAIFQKRFGYVFILFLFLIFLPLAMPKSKKYFSKKDYK